MKLGVATPGGTFPIEAKHAILKKGISIRASQTIEKHNSDLERA